MSPPTASHRPAAWRLLRDALLFGLPFLLVIGALEAVVWATGETWPHARVVQVQARSPETLYIRGQLGQDLHAYKWVVLQARRPRVVALGSSRVMQFRAGMFGEDAGRFYTAGGLIKSLDDLDLFTRRLSPAVRPEVVILGIDPWWLNDRWDTPEKLATQGDYDAATDWRAHGLLLRHLVTHPRELAQISRSLRADRARPAIGLGALLKGAGFRADGSYQYALTLPRSAAEWGYTDRSQPTVGEQVSAGTYHFPRTDGLSEARLRLLAASLTRLRVLGVQVVGFTPPVASDVARLLESDAGQRPLWTQYRRRVAACFADQGVPFVDASTPAALGLDDRYMMDGMHALETFHVHLLLRMLDDPRVARSLPTARAGLRRALRSRQTNPWYAALPGGPRTERQASRVAETR